MASTTTTKLDRATLLAALRAAFGSQVPRAALPLELPAVLFPIVLWESGGVLNRDSLEPDGSHSRGLFQVNQTEGVEPFDGDEATPGALQGAVPGEGQTLAGAIGYELDYARPHIAGTYKALSHALSALGERLQAGEAVAFNAAVDLPVWFSLAWQYGDGALSRWVADPSTVDFTPDGFKAFRIAHDLVVWPDFDARQKFVAETYLGNLENPALLFAALRDASTTYGVDFFTSAAKTIGAKSADLAEWMKKKAADGGAALRDALLPDPRKWAASAGVGLGVVAVAAFVLWHIATQDTPHGRRIHPKIQESVIAWAVKAFATAEVFELVVGLL